MWEDPLSWIQLVIASKTFSGEFLQVVPFHNEHDLWWYHSNSQREVAIGYKVQEKKRHKGTRRSLRTFLGIFFLNLGQSCGHRKSNFKRIEFVPCCLLSFHPPSFLSFCVPSNMLSSIHEVLYLVFKKKKTCFTNEETSLSMVQMASSETFCFSQS